VGKGFGCWGVNFRNKTIGMGLPPVSKGARHTKDGICAKRHPALLFGAPLKNTTAREGSRAVDVRRSLARELTRALEEG
jgi:hypothetical protein